MTFTEQEIKTLLKEFWLDPYTTDNQYVEIEIFVNQLFYSKNAKYKYVLKNLNKRQLEQEQQLKKEEV